MKRFTIKKIMVAVFAVPVLLAVLAAVNWILAPLTVPEHNLDMHLMGVIVRYINKSPHQVTHIGKFENKQVVDFAESEMVICPAGLRKYSLIEPAGMGGGRDSETGKNAYLLLSAGYCQTGRNTFEINVINLSGFCAFGITYTLHHTLAGWIIVGHKPFYDF